MIGALGGAVSNDVGTGGCVDGECVGTQVGRVATGAFSSCAIRQEGQVYCWGLLTPTVTADPDYSVQRVPFTGPAESLAANRDGMTCAVLTGGSTACLGGNRFGGLGNGSTEDAALPRPVVGLANASRLSMSSARTAARTDDGRVFVWGLYRDDEDFGQPVFGPETPPLTEITQVLGSTTITRIAVLSPSRVAGISQAAQMTLGRSHACILASSGQVSCWGTNEAGQLGTTTIDTVDEPLAVPGMVDAIYVDAGSRQTCAVRSNGTVACWGSTCALGDSQDCASLGAGPQQVPGLSDAIQVEAQTAGACALRRTGEVVCWGENTSGGLGNGETSDSETPVAVLGLSDIEVLGVSNDHGGHTCGQRRTGDIVCWGLGILGQLGDGSTELFQNVPVPVIDLPD